MRIQPHFKYYMIITWVWHKCDVGICVYMLDGERPWSNDELPQTCVYIGPARDRTWLWRVRSHAHH